MKNGTGVLCGIAAGLGVGVGAVVAVIALGSPKPAKAASNDRYDDYVMATGAVSVPTLIVTLAALLMLFSGC